jgi:hypothetical protein
MSTGRGEDCDDHWWHACNGGTLEQVANRIGDWMIPDLPALVDQPQRSAPKPAGDPRAIAP